MNEVCTHVNAKTAKRLAYRVLGKHKLRKVISNKLFLLLCAAVCMRVYSERNASVLLVNLLQCLKTFPQIFEAGVRVNLDEEYTLTCAALPQ